MSAEELMTGCGEKQLSVPTRELEEALAAVRYPAQRLVEMVLGLGYNWSHKSKQHLYRHEQVHTPCELQRKEL